MQDPKLEHFGSDLEKVTNLSGSKLYPILLFLEEKRVITARQAPRKRGQKARRLIRLSGNAARMIEENSTRAQG